VRCHKSVVRNRLPRARAQKENSTMLSPNPNAEPSSFFSRILSNDALKKGCAAAIAGVIVAAVSETLWPSDR
jgi:hypothetical protein